MSVSLRDGERREVAARTTGLMALGVVAGARAIELLGLSEKT